MRVIVAFSVAISLASCSSLYFQDISSLQKSLGIVNLPTPSRYPGANAVIILDRTDVRTAVDSNYNYSTITTFYRVKRIFSDIVKQSAVEIRIRPGETLLQIMAQTVEPDGRIVKLESRDLRVVYGGPLKGSVSHSDIGQVSFRFPDVVRGAIVEYAYQIADEMPFPSGEWVIQHSVPIMRSIYSLTVPSFMIGNTEKDQRDWYWNYVTYNYPDIGKPTFGRRYGSGGKQGNWHDLTGYTVTGELQSEGRDDGHQTEEDVFTWTLKDVPAFVPDPDMPPKDWYRGYVQFAPWSWRTWDDISRWYYDDFIGPGLVNSDGILVKAGLLAKGATTKLDTIDRFFHYVQGIHYSESKKLLGRLSPENPQKVMDNFSGDCRGKAVLLLALLKALGFSAKPAIIITRSNGKLDPTFPCLRFHRMIIGVLVSDTSLVWLDPAVKYCRLGEIPPQDEASVALVLNSNGTSFLVATPSSQAWDNTVSVDVNVTEHMKSDAGFHVTIRYSGEEDLEMRNKLAGAARNQIWDYCRAMISGGFTDSKILNCSISPPDSLNTYFTLSFDFQASNVVERGEGLYSLYADPFPAIEDLSWLIGGRREYPVDFDYPYTLHKEIDIAFNDSAYSVKSMPKVVELNSADFDYSSSYSEKEPGRLIFNEVFTSKARLLPPDICAAAEDFFEKVGEAKASAVVLARTEMSGRY